SLDTFGSLTSLKGQSFRICEDHQYSKLATICHHTGEITYAPLSMSYYVPGSWCHS
ncbi:12039_t:CDS:1, partial [Ambispora leptoticha]